MQKTIEAYMRMKFHDDHGIDAEISAQEIRRIYTVGMESFVRFVEEEFKKLVRKKNGTDV